MRAFTLGERLRYRFDNLMARGTVALVVGLALVSLLVIVLVAAAVVALGVAPAGDDGARPGFGELVWITFMRTLDAGNLGGDSGAVLFVGLMLVATVAGIFVVSAFIGVLTSGLEDKLGELRKGRSLVVETGHVLVLGWSSHVVTIVRELATAAANKGGAVVVILARRDKVEMEDEIRAKAGDLGRTRVVCRSGDPVDLDDLAIGSPETARAIIVLGPEGDEPDSDVIKTVLALTSHKRRADGRHHIVAELRDPKNLGPAKMVGKGEASFVLASELIARITVQTCRQSGLSVIYGELLDFDGDEIYLAEEARLVGKTFGEALSRYEDSALIGLCTADDRVLLNPPMDTEIHRGDRVIVISEDDDTVRIAPGEPPSVDEAVLRPPVAVTQEPERTLVLGWNRRAPTMLLELDKYVAPGSVVTVVADVDGAEEAIARECGDVRRQRIGFTRGDTTDRRVLDGLEVHAYEHVITLGYSDDLDPHRADARTLITLLHLRDIEEKMGESFSIVSEMLDEKNRQLAEVTKADDFIVSDNLVSLAIAQIAENRHLADVFTDLFDADGSELYLRPAGDYVAIDAELTFHAVVEAARRRGEVAIGYRRIAESADARASYGVHVNPKKRATLRFADGDKVIVLAAA